MKWLGALCLLAAVACTKPNPRSCADGICNDQSYPFCDVDGMLGGEPKECIAVTCTPSEFEACRNDKELRCSATGNNYDLVQCELGCSTALDGCRLCEPNETRCTNGKVATCNALGEIVSSEACAFGCFDDQPRCRRINPSNSLAQYLDTAMFLIDADLENAIFEVDTGVVRVGAQIHSLPTYFVQPTGNGVPIRVFVAKSFKLKNATVFATGDPRERASAGIALLSHGDIHLSGIVKVSSRAGGAITDCNPGDGTSRDYGDNNGAASGGGGGGNATEGAEGGEITGRHPRGAKDSTSGTIEVEPLRGGCAGGFELATTPGEYHNGGGAIQLSSNTKVVIDGTIDVRGEGGEVEWGGFVLINGGGGAGGSILIEAADVTLGPNAKLLATGGNGATACSVTATCGVGGQGATTTAPATVGGSVGYTTAGNTAMSAGGGGGGLGRIRINTRSNAYTKSSTTVEAASVTTGTIGTR